MRVSKFLMKNGLWVCLGVLCSFLISQSVVLGMDAIADQIDALVNQGPIDIQTTLGIVLPLIVIATVASLAQGKCIGKYSVKVMAELQSQIAGHIIKVRNRFWVEESSGKLLTKITSDIAEIEKFTSNTLPNFLNALISIAMVAIYVGSKNIYMLLITASLYPIIIVIMTFWGNILRGLAQKRRGNIDTLVEQVIDCISGIEVVKSYNLSSVFMSKIEGSIQKILDNEYKRAWIMHFSQTLQRFLFCIPNMVCPLVALVLVLRGKITIGEMTAYIVLVNKIISNMKQLPFLIADAKEKRVSMDRINRILCEPVKKDISESSTTDGSIVMEQVNFHYGDEKTVLKNMSLKLDRHKTYGFVGMSGQGKSTIFRLLSGLETEYEGICHISKNCAIVPQQAFLFSGTIAENIGIGCVGVTMEEIVIAAKAAGIHEKIESLEQKYETKIGENGAGLSGGEKQRICIARALVSGADVLLLDEPTASVDAETEQIIINTLRELQGKKTIVLISHRLSLMQVADEILVVHEGKIAEQGSPDNLIQRNGLYKNLWEREMCNEV